MSKRLHQTILFRFAHFPATFTELAVLIDRLADSTGLVAESDLAVDLSAVLQRLSSLQKKEKDMLETQAKMDVVHLMNCAEEYIRTIGSVRVSVNPTSAQSHRESAKELNRILLYVFSSPLLLESNPTSLGKASKLSLVD